MNKAMARLAVFYVLTCFMCGCGHVVRAIEAQFDTPGHHVKNGMRLLERGKIDAAFQDFILAEEIAPSYSCAYIGLGLVWAYREDFNQALSHIELSIKYAKSVEDKVDAHIGYIRLYTLGKSAISGEWLEKAKGEFKNALALDPLSFNANFYMGLAYKEALEFDYAVNLMRKAVELDEANISNAREELIVLQKIQRGMPETAIGKRIAIADKITRGDVAAIFIYELKLEALLYGKDSHKLAAGNLQSADDVADHVFSKEINTLIGLGIHGIEPYPDCTFRPKNIITRAEYAVMLESILVKVTGDKGLATRFIGRPSPFIEIGNDMPFFNAVMVCVSRGILQVDGSTGEFNPLATVSGSDALLAVRAVKSQIGR
ncbi:MAG: S-layer homology domain-containing protein [Pseudomonadota bacterium]